MRAFKLSWWKTACAVVALCAAAAIGAPAQTFTTLVNLGLTSSGGPEAPLAQGLDGNLYGTTAFGGSSGYGTVFKVTPTGSLTTLHSFLGYPTEGAYPYAGLTLGTDGNFYGTTQIGTTSVSFNGTPATFTMVSSTLITTMVPAGASTGPVQVTTPSGTLTSNVPFRVR